MITAKEEARAVNAIELATLRDQLRIKTEACQLYLDQLQIVSDQAKTNSQAWNVLGSYYANGYFSVGKMKSDSPPKPERIMAGQLCRDDLAELRLWWDWKQLDDDVKREMLPPLCPSEMTQAFMGTNPAWKFRQDGTLVASLTDDAFKNATEKGYEPSFLVGEIFEFSAFVLLCLAVLVVWAHLIGFWQ